MNSRHLSLVSLSLILAVGTVSAAQIKMTGHIGSHQVSFTGKTIGIQAVYTVKGQPEYLAVTEIYPDTTKEVQYRYQLTAPGIGTYLRSRKSLGFGPISYFIKVNKQPLGQITISKASSTGLNPVCISAVRGVSASEMRTLTKEDNFRLVGHIPHIPSADPVVRKQQVDEFMARLRTKPEFHITRGMMSEICYAYLDTKGVKEELELCQKWAKQYQVPMMLGMVSWWRGTPLYASDGQGGVFGDLKYQQVCYSPDVEMPENPTLRAFLGERYNHHYGLSIPNIWSNTPWLTMNSDLLNNYRKKRIDETIGTLKQISPNDQSWISGVFLENEPRYWDTQAEEGNDRAGRQGKPLWGDFNPLVIEAARKDGVEIDPSDGMSDTELSWMHQNVGRYCQDTVNYMNEATKSHRWGAKLPVYTHTMQYRCFYGTDQIKHDSAEWAYAKGADTGIEGIFCNVSDFYRIREWGRWVNLNREETDGMPTDTHLWDLRVDYMMGGDLYNSYNWPTLGTDKFIAYVNEFLDNLPVVNTRPTQARLLNNNTLAIRASMKLQAFTSITLPVTVAKPLDAQLSLVVKDASGNEYHSSPQSVLLQPGRHQMSFEFTTPAECGYVQDAALSLRACDAKGSELSGMVEFAPVTASKIMLSLDLQTQRILSRWVIKQSKAQSWR